MEKIKSGKLLIPVILLIILSIAMAIPACSPTYTTPGATTAAVPPASSPTAAPSAFPAATTPPAAATGGPSGNNGNAIDLTAANLAFDKSTITVKAGSQVTINFNNKDTSIPHNFAAYTDSTASTVIFKGNVINGPRTTVYTFTAPTTPGTYFFRCDVHPTMMTGRFIVE